MNLVRRHWRIAGTAGAAALFRLVWGCSKKPGAGPAGSAHTAAESKPENAAQSALDEDLPPIVRTPWKGDLDGIVTRRVVPVLVPFR
ncbi:MAG TPA: hypothetical protein VMJ75_14645 [Candidatus Acidoferrales bacterium]|nr:hypothetical protein [Candidatus Acidoferrales bacterium]